MRLDVHFGGPDWEYTNKGNGPAFNILNRLVGIIGSDHLMYALCKLNKKEIKSVQKKLVLLEIFILLIPHVNDKASYLIGFLEFFQEAMNSKQRHAIQYKSEPMEDLFDYQK